ncbi:hypothetical protein RJ55_06227 [Drechmeria coniospora]|nr:hypothetical protein RJ55_06227 [Drechmeria coniospora]
MPQLRTEKGSLSVRRTLPWTGSTLELSNHGYHDAWVHDHGPGTPLMSLPLRRVLGVLARTASSFADVEFRRPAFEARQAVKRESWCPNSAERQRISIAIVTVGESRRDLARPRPGHDSCPSVSAFLQRSVHAYLCDPNPHNVGGSDIVTSLPSSSSSSESAPSSTLASPGAWTECSPQGSSQPPGRLGYGARMRRDTCCWLSSAPASASCLGPLVVSPRPTSEVGHDSGGAPTMSATLRQGCPKTSTAGGLLVANVKPGASWRPIHTSKSALVKMDSKVRRTLCAGQNLPYLGTRPRRFGLAFALLSTLTDDDPSSVRSVQAQRTTLQNVVLVLAAASTPPLSSSMQDDDIGTPTRIHGHGPHTVLARKASFTQVHMQPALPFTLACDVPVRGEEGNEYSRHTVPTHCPVSPPHHHPLHPPNLNAVPPFLAR